MHKIIEQNIIRSEWNEYNESEHLGKRWIRFVKW